MAEEQVRKKKKRKKKHYLLRLLVVIAVLVGLYFLATSELFDIRQIAVEGNSYYTKEQIISLSGVKVGTNLFETRCGNAADKLLKDAYIKGAELSMKLPDTLVITVTERQEAAAVPYGEDFILLDIDGMVLRKTDVSPQLPVLMGMTIRGMEPGTPLEVEESSNLTGALKILEVMENSDIYFTKIDISNVVVRAYIYDQLLCKGMPENIQESMQNGNLGAVVYDLNSRGTEHGTITISGDNYCSFSPEY